MRNLIKTAVILCGLGSAAAAADAPPAYWAGTFKVQTVACYSQEAANELIKASKKNKTAAEFKKLNASKSCELYAPGTIFGVIDSTDVGLVHGANEVFLHAWIVHGGTPIIPNASVKKSIKEIWFIFSEKDNSIDA